MQHVSSTVWRAAAFDSLGSRGKTDSNLVLEASGLLAAPVHTLASEMDEPPRNLRQATRRKLFLPPLMRFNGMPTPLGFGRNPDNPWLGGASK